MSRDIPESPTRDFAHQEDMFVGFNPEIDDPRTFRMSVPRYPANQQFEAQFAGLVVDIENTGLVRLEKYLHAGHGKTITSQDLTNNNWIGVISQYTGSPRSNNFMYHLNTFQQYRINGQNSWTGRTGWYYYNPFASGEPWAAYNYKGEAFSEADMVAKATAVGDAFVRTDIGKVRRITAVTSAQADYEAIRPRPIVPQFFGNPVAEFWASGQAERWPNAHSYNPTRTLSIVRLPFATRANKLPNAHYNGGGHLIGDPFLAQANISADVDDQTAIFPRRASIGGNTVFSLDAGVYSFSFRLSTPALSTSVYTRGVSLKAALSGADKVIAEAQIPSHRAATVPTSRYQKVESSCVIEAKYISVAATDQFYWLAEGFPTTAFFRYYMQIQKEE